MGLSIHRTVIEMDIVILGHLTDQSLFLMFDHRGDQACQIQLIGFIFTRDVHAARI